MKNKRGIRIMIYVLAAAILLPLVLIVVSRNYEPKPPVELGVRDNQLADCAATPNCVSTTATDESKRMPPIPFSGTPTEAMTKLKARLADMPRTTIVSESERYLHATQTSRLFRFIDDVEFLIEPDSGVIHFRSASRLGKSDLGVNRARMERFTSDFASR